MATINQIQIKRGTTLSNAGTPAAGEPIWKSDTNALYIGDGSTAATSLESIGGTTVSGTDNRIVRMNSTDGIQDSGITVADSTDNVSGMGTLGCGVITSTGSITSGGSFIIGSASMNETDLEKLDGITNGTAAASKALVLDASKDIGTIRNLTIDGVFTDGNYSFDTSGNVTGMGTLACGAITTISNANISAGSGSVTCNNLVVGGTDINSSEITVLNGASSNSVASKACLYDVNGDFEMQDSDKIFFGNSADVSIFWDGTMKIGTNTSGAPITIGHSTSEVAIGDNLTVTGNLTVSGDTTTVTSTTVATGDSLIKLAKDQDDSADAVDFGIYGVYGESDTAKYAGIFRDQSESGDPWTFFDSLQADPGTTVNTGGTGFDYADLKAGAITSVDGFTGDITGDVTGNADTVTNGVYTSNNLSVMAATTSAQLRGVLSDETGTGVAVFATSPTLVTPALGTPSALVGTSITGTGASFTAGAVTNGVYTTSKISVLAATSSSELAGVISDETGSGALVFGTSPTLTTPALGTPSALVGTSISGTGASFTAGAVTGATFTKNLTVNTGNVTLTGHSGDSSALTIGTGAVSVSGANTGDNTVATALTGTPDITVGTVVVTTEITMGDDDPLKLGASTDGYIVHATAALAADAETPAYVEGTSDHLGYAANSLVISNVTDDGDIAFYVSDGGNSRGVLLLNGDDGNIYTGGSADFKGEGVAISSITGFAIDGGTF